MATANLKLQSTYKFGMNDWTSGWLDPLTSTNNNGDDNRFYVGGKNDKRLTKFKIYVDSSLVIGKSKKLIIKITPDSNFTPRCMRAYLSTTNPNYSDSYSTIINNSIEMSYLYYDTSKSEQTAYSDGELSARAIYAIFDQTVFQAGKYYFVTLLPFNSTTGSSVIFDNTWLRAKNTASACNVTFEYESYSKVSNPTSPKCTSQIYRDGAVTISWGKATDGLNNPVKNYNIYCEIGKYPTVGSTSSTQKIFVAEASASSRILYNNSTDGIKASKGDKVYFSIRAIGTVSGFDSDLINIGYCTIINKPPVWPTFDVTGVILASTPSSQVTINNIRPNKEPGDVDEDTLTYYYKVDAQSANPSPTGATEITNGTTIIVTKETPSIFIWAYDGTEYGGYGKRTVAVNVLPEIQSINVSGENILSNSGYSCTRYLNASATLNKVVATYKWYIWVPKSLTYELLGEGESLDKVSIEKWSIPGAKIRIKLIVTDTVGEEAEKEETFNIYQMQPIKGIIGFNIARNETAKGTVNANYINTKIKATLTLSATEPTDIPFNLVEIYAETDTSTIKIFSNQTVRSGTYTFEYNFQYDSGYSFYVQVRDNANRTVKRLLSTVFYRLPLIDLSQANNQITPREWHVLKDKTFSVSTANIDSSGTGINTYRVQGSVNNGGYVTLLQFDSQTAGATVNGDTITYLSSDGFEVFKKLKVKTNAPVYTVNYRIIALNAFGVESDASYYGQIQNCTIITREAPTFSASTVFQARVGFIKGPEYISEAEYNSIPKDNNTPANQMFNPGEVIDFCLSELATDLNSLYFDGQVESQKEAISYYQVDYHLTSSIQTPSESWVWKELTTLSESNWTETEEFYHQSVIAPQLSTSKYYVYLRISAVDDTGLRSEYLQCAIPLICCRKVAPNGYFKQNEILFQENKIKVPFVISDFGGNNFRYENFFRKGTETATITLKYGNSLENLIIGTIWSNKIDMIPDFLEFIPEITFSGKIYFQLSIDINTNTIDNEYNSVATTLPIHIYYLDSPTVSYRPHWIGINTSFRISSDVLRIEAVQDNSTESRRNHIHFAGFNNNEETLTSINIDTGHIYGFIINGGTWDA